MDETSNAQEHPEVQEERESEQIEPAAEAQPLSLNLQQISSQLSQLSRTANGLNHAFTRLDVTNSKLTNISLLEKYPHLRIIDLSNNLIADLKPLAALEYLLSLEMSHNMMVSAKDLDKKKYLQILNLSHNKLSAFSQIQLESLTNLNLNSNDMSELTLDFPQVSHLECRGNRIKQVIALNSPKLVRLYMANNIIGGITAIGLLSSLQILHLRQNTISVLDMFTGAKLVALSYLNLRLFMFYYRDNKIAEMSEIDKLSHLQLQKLVLTGNPICEMESYRLGVISRLEKLTKLDKEEVSEEEKLEAKTYIGLSALKKPVAV